jgi:phosphoserine aminotransferase
MRDFMEKRIYNFNPGPAALPLSVLKEVKKDLISYKSEGLSVLEMSHRGKTFEAIIKQAEALLKEVLAIPNGYKVIFMQGGATLQFAAVPLNLLPDNQSADYVITGSWAKNAFKEAQKLNKKVRTVTSSESSNFDHIPKDFTVDSNAAYLHLTSNNTIFGTQWHTFPQSGTVPLVCDMSSDIACRPVDVAKFALIYAGAQKNIGPAGVAIVIVREELLQKSPANIPTIMNYKLMAEKESLYNTPPTFSIYISKLVLEWIKNEGGLEKIGKINQNKADLIYNVIDAGEFYRGTVHKADRSIMNVTFRLPSEDLENKFVNEAKERNMIGLKGHRSVGGIRASIYNAVSLEAVQALVDFMKEFEKTNG